MPRQSGQGDARSGGFSVYLQRNPREHSWDGRRLVKDSDKERTKLLATAFKNLGVATLTVAVVTPTVAYLYGVGPAPALSKIGAFTAFFLGVAFSLHVLAAFVLKDLDP
jgi:hypothetical protein